MKDSEKYYQMSCPYLTSKLHWQKFVSINKLLNQTLS